MIDELTTLENVVEWVGRSYGLYAIYVVIDELVKLDRLEERNNIFCIRFNLGTWFFGRLNDAELNVLVLLTELAEKMEEESKESGREQDVVKQGKRLWNRRGF